MLIINEESRKFYSAAKEEAIVFFNFISNRLALSTIFLLLFICVEYLFLSLYSVSNMQWILSSLLQSVATFIALLITGAIFVITLSRTETEKEQSYRRELKALLRKHLSKLSNHRKYLQKNFLNSVSKGEQDDTDLYNRMYTASIIEYAINPKPEIIQDVRELLNHPTNDLFNMVHPDRSDFFNMAQDIADNPSMLEYILSRISDNKDMAVFLNELTTFIWDNGFGYKNQKAAFSRYTGRRFQRVLVSLIISFTIIVLAELLVGTTIPVNIGGVSLKNITPFLIAGAVYLTFIAILLLIRFIFKFFKTTVYY